MLYHGRIYVPQGAVKLVMKKLHIQHTTVDKTLQNARSMYFWLGMKNNIKLIWLVMFSEVGQLKTSGNDYRMAITLDKIRQVLF